MRDTRSLAIWAIAFMLSTTFAAASPQVNFPLNLQFPPVARVGEAYNFQFAVTTFQPKPEKLQYSLIGNPTWLSLNSQNRTLWGTPGAGDIGTTTFTIAAAEEAGPVANMESKLLVTDAPMPTVAGDISQQLSNTGQLSGPKRLSLSPSKSFDIKFPPDTFQAGQKSFAYHATLDDHTPLPAWISFDASTLHFAGTTPPLTSWPQEHNLLLVASDTPGYTAASVSFTIVVSNHQFLFRPLQQTVNATKGDHFMLKGLKNQLFLDNTPVMDSDILLATAEVPSWLSFDNRTFDLTGDAPSGLMSQEITISVKSRYGDTAEMSIRVNIKSELFEGEIGKLNIIAGEPFSYRIPNSILAQNKGEVSIDFGPLSEWLRFNTDTLTIAGTVPKDVSKHDAQATLIVVSGDGKSRDTQTINFQITGTETHVSTDSSSSGIAPAQPSGSVESSNARFDQPRSKRAGLITGVVIAAFVGLMLVVALMVVLCRRRKKSPGYLSPNSRSPRKFDISRPVIKRDEGDEGDGTFDADVENGDTEVTLLERTPEHPPQLQLDTGHKRKDSGSVASTMGEKEDKIFTDFDRSPWGFRDAAGPSHSPHESMRIPTAMARRSSQKPEVPPKNPRRKAAVHRDLSRCSGLPINRRPSGMGHGRHTYSPSKTTTNLSRLSTQSGSTRTISILSTVPSAIPRPPTARHTTQFTTPMEKRRSVRLVPSTSGNLSKRDSFVDRRTIDEKRQSYIRKRASAQSPFFGAGSSRISSASFKSPVLANDSRDASTAAPLESSSLNVNVREEVLHGHEKELPEILRIRKPSDTPSVETRRAFPGSLRRQPTERSFARYTITAANDGDRVQKRYERPGTAIYARPGVRRQPSQRETLHAYRIKSDLNSLTGIKVYDDDEMSESMYSTEEEDIEEYEKRTTVKPNQFAFPPLRNVSIRARKKHSRRISQRDPTPYSLALEHGGKENQSSTYSLDILSKAQGKRKAMNLNQSPERPKTSGKRQSRASHHTRTESHTTHRSSTQRVSSQHASTKRTSQNRPLSGQLSHTTRHSRNQSSNSQAHHSRTQSRQSTARPGGDRSRTQSSAYPHFDPLTLPPDAEQAKDEPKDQTKRLSTYAVHEDPTNQELESSSIGVRTSKGRISTSARQSRHAKSTSQSQTRSQARTSKRETIVRPQTPTSDDQNPAIGLGLDLNLSLFPTPDSPSHTLTPSHKNRAVNRERTPLSVLETSNGNGGYTPSPTCLRKGEDKGGRLGSGEGDDGGRKTKTWGSLQGIMNRGRYRFDERESKAFL